MPALPLDDWLALLQGHLAILRCEGVALVEGLVVGEGARWCPGLDDSASVIAATPALPSGSPGWLFGESAAPDYRHLFVATRQPLDPDDPRLAVGASMCRFVLALLSEHDSRAALSRQPMHALRNGLNGVSMAAAVLTQNALPPSLLPFADDLQEAVERCLQALRQLSALITPSPAPRWHEPTEPAEPRSANRIR